jgi:hypothetical protein
LFEHRHRVAEQVVVQSVRVVDVVLGIVPSW